MSQKAEHMERALDLELLRLVAKAARKLMRAKPKQGITRDWGEDTHHFDKHHRADLKALGLEQGVCADLTDAEIEERLSNYVSRPGSAMERMGRYLQEVGRMLPDTRAAFHPEPLYEDLMVLCMHMGWAICDVSGGYRWLDRVAPAMQAAGKWDAQCVSRQDLVRQSAQERAARTEADIAKALATMPEMVRQQICEMIRREGTFRAVKRLNIWHDGTGWRDRPDPALEPAMPAAGLQFGTEIIRHLNEGMR